MADSSAKRRWDAENTVRISVKLNRKTDARIIARLDAVENKASYIKSLVLRDIDGDALPRVFADDLPGIGE